MAHGVLLKFILQCYYYIWEISINTFFISLLHFQYQRNMMKNSKLMKTITILTLIALFLPILPVMAQETVDRTGPWADELIFKIYLNQEAEYLALKSGEINVMDWQLPADKVEDALADPNIMTESYQDLGYYLIDINCQRWPTSDVHFRRALAHLVDKARIVTDVLEGFGYSADEIERLREEGVV